MVYFAVRTVGKGDKKAESSQNPLADSFRQSINRELWMLSAKITRAFVYSHVYLYKPLGRARLNEEGSLVGIKDDAYVLQYARKIRRTHTAAVATIVSIGTAS